MHPLDNVIWNALTTRQSEFAESFGEARRFMPDVTSLAGFREPTFEGYKSLAGLPAPGGTIALFLDQPYQPQEGWNLVAGAPLLQMVCESRDFAAASRADGEPHIIMLGTAHVPEMMELTALTKPGPFNKRTHELGGYSGIRQNGNLVAMSGERLKVPGYTEVSAVCTHPDHTGHGYAAALMREVMCGIVDRGETPFLHTREDNLRAIALYERLGFTTRTRVHLAVLRKAPA